MITLAVPSAVEPQEVASNSSGLQCIPAETTMPTTISLEVGHVTPLWHHELRNNPIAALQLVEFLDAKMVDWDEDLKEKAAPLCIDPTQYEPDS